MPCKSGCCGGDAAPPESQAPVLPATACEEPADERPPSASGCADNACCAAQPKGSEDGCCADPSEAAGNCSTSSGAAAPQGCEDGCCSGKEEAKGEQPKPCEDACCPGKEAAKIDEPEPCEDGCCAGQEPADSCSTPSGVAGPQSCDDRCCAGEKSGKTDQCKSPMSECDNAGEKDCCSSGQPVSTDPPCCEGKQRPCCDVSCIERIINREASEECGTASSTCGKASRSRKETLREKYATRLEAIGCLCRALIALGQESCCPPRPLSSVERKRGSKKAPKGACCSKKFRSKPQPIKDSSQSLSQGCSGGQDSCCRASADSERPKSPACAKGCCGSVEVRSCEPIEKQQPCCSSTSCGGEDYGAPTDLVSKLPAASVVRTTDLEKGNAGSEHVVLGISGMTCTGCETKLQRVLKEMPVVTNLRTSLVMGRAEFDLEGSAAEDIMKYIESRTEFKCDRIMKTGSTIEVVPPTLASEFVRFPLPDGVEEMKAINERLVRITFDPRVIGARDLLQNGFQNRLRLAPPQTDPMLANGKSHVRNMGLITLASAMLTIPVLILAWAPLEERPVTYGAISLALATIIQVAIAGPFYPKAIKSLIFSGMIEMDLLIVLSTTAAYVFSVVSFGYLVSGQALSTGEFFETSTLLVTLIMVGRWISALARQKAVEAISVKSLQSPTATLVSPNGHEVELDVRLLQYGDVFKVAPETNIPTDAIILSGTTEVDESLITGESRPVEKSPGSMIIAGSINGQGTITAKLSKLPFENTINTIATMVDEAKLSKPKVQQLADNVASYFVPVIVALAIIVFVVWIAVGMRLQGKSASDSVIQAVTYAITVLIVSCPCAIGLAVPMVIVIAGGVAAEKGVIFKTAEGIEVAHKASHIVFDKTGTLTEGKLSVTTEAYVGCSRPSLAPKLLGLVTGIKHPVSIAVSTHLSSQGFAAAEVSEVKSLPGKGVEGLVDGRWIRAGNCRWLGVESDPAVQAVLATGRTAFCVTLDSDLRAVLGLADTLRPDAAPALRALRARGIAVSLLSGDDPGPVGAAAEELGIPASHARARCEPADKRAYVRDLLLHREESGKQQVVLFVGDGTNDAAALAQATLGVHVSGSGGGGAAGTDVAKVAADVVALASGPAAVLAAIDVSRAAARRIRFNFAWSAVYNALAVALAAGVLVAAREGARIPPAFAGLGELVSVLPVVCGAVSLRWARV
ncbi:heavy metal translocatin [Xylariomycetidae sp. FL0641]|nr:heavy metal translocatin [Xylariomycetidae sp. FL0641]